MKRVVDWIFLLLAIACILNCVILVAHRYQWSGRIDTRPIIIGFGAVVVAATFWMRVKRSR